MDVKCPTCKKPAEYSSANRFRPFCSKRCQTHDLAAWADEKYAVPVNEQEREPVNANPDAQDRDEQELSRDRQ